MSLRRQISDLYLSREEYIEKYSSPTRGADRYLLINASENSAKNQEEINALISYQKSIDGMNQLQEMLSDGRTEILKLSIKKGKRNAAKIETLEKTEKVLANIINNVDKILFQLEATRPLKDILEREKRVAYERNLMSWTSQTNR